MGNLTAIERFWSKVDKSGECWLWTAYRNKGGYGWFNGGGKPMLAHRFSFEQANGLTPKGMCVLHKCDVRACVNPDHLFPGTYKDNGEDMARKGRCMAQQHPEKVSRGDNHYARSRPELLARGARHGSITHPGSLPHGSAHHNARFSECDIVEIRKQWSSGATVASLAKKYKCSRCAVKGICFRITWKHVV